MTKTYVEEFEIEEIEQDGVIIIGKNDLVQEDTIVFEIVTWTMLVKRLGMFFVILIAIVITTGIFLFTPFISEKSWCFETLRSSDSVQLGM